MTTPLEHLSVSLKSISNKLILFGDVPLEMVVIHAAETQPRRSFRSVHTKNWSTSIKRSVLIWSWTMPPVNMIGTEWYMENIFIFHYLLLIPLKNDLLNRDVSCILWPFDFISSSLFNNHRVWCPSTRHWLHSNGPHLLDQMSHSYKSTDWDVASYFFNTVRVIYFALMLWHIHFLFSLKN